MVKIKAISRDRRDFTRERKGELMRVSRNPQPELHPFERARAAFAGLSEEVARELASLEIDEGFRFDTGMGPDDLVPAIRFGPVDKS